MTQSKSAPTTTQTVMSFSTLAANSMVAFECDAPAAEIGETYTFTDGANSFPKTFSITCKNAGTPEVEVNWHTLSAQNDIFVAPP